MAWTDVLETLETYDRLIREGRVSEALNVLYDRAGPERAGETDWDVALGRFRARYGRPPLLPGERDDRFGS